MWRKMHITGSFLLSDKEENSPQEHDSSQFFQVSGKKARSPFTFLLQSYISEKSYVNICHNLLLGSGLNFDAYIGFVERKKTTKFYMKY